MSESARVFCQRCLRAFLDLVDGDAPSDFHRSIRELVKKSPKCRACYESYARTATLCRKAWPRARTPGRSDALLTQLRRELKDRR